MDSIIYWEIETYPGQTIPPANWAQDYRALLDQDSMSYWEINTSPGQTDPHESQHRSTEPYYTITVWAIEKSTHNQGRQTPANQAQVYRALLDQDSMSYWEINTYPGHTDPHKLSTGLQSPTTPGYYDLLINLDIPPVNQAQVHRALLHHENMRYWEIETYQGQIDLMPIEHNLQLPTTPGQYELLKNQHITKADRSPANQAQVYRALVDQDSMSYWEINTYQGRQTPHKLSTGLQSLLPQDNMTYWEIETYQGHIDPELIEYMSTEPYYTSTVWAIDKSAYTQGRQMPLLIEHKSTDPY